MQHSVSYDCRILVLTVRRLRSGTLEPFRRTVWTPPQRTITFGICTAPCETAVPANHPAARGYLVHKVSSRMCVQHCRQGQGVRPRKENPVHFGCIRKANAIESRKVNCRRPLMSVAEMTDCGTGVCFGPQRQGFSFDPRTGKRLISHRHLAAGTYMTMTLEPGAATLLRQSDNVLDIAQATCRRSNRVQGSVNQYPVHLLMKGLCRVANSRKLGLIVGALRFACNDLCTAARFHTVEENPGCIFVSLCTFIAALPCLTTFALSGLALANAFLLLKKSPTLQNCRSQ